MITSVLAGMLPVSLSMFPQCGEVSPVKGINLGLLLYQIVSPELRPAVLRAQIKKINRINVVVHLKRGSEEAACEDPCATQRLTGLSRSRLHCVLFIFTLFKVNLSNFHNSLKQGQESCLKD